MRVKTKKPLFLVKEEELCAGKEREGREESYWRRKENLGRRKEEGARMCSCVLQKRQFKRG